MSDVTPLSWTSSDGTALAGYAAGSGPDVVFLHEFASTADAWKPAIADLRADFRCLAFGARGYPPSEVPRDTARLTQEGMCIDLDAVVRSCEGPVSLVGFSMGALTALLYALSRPARVKRLVLVGIGTGMSPASRVETFGKLEGMARLFETEGSPAVARIADRVAGPTPARKNPAGWDEFREGLARLPAEAAAAILRNVQLRRPVWDDLRQGLSGLGCPTLVIAGDGDRECVEAAIFLRDTMPSAQVAVFPGSGHLIPVEEPALFTAAVRRFLSADPN